MYSKCSPGGVGGGLWDRSQRGTEGVDEMQTSRPHRGATLRLISHFPPEPERGPLYMGFLTGAQAPEHPPKNNPL